MKPPPFTKFSVRNGRGSEFIVEVEIDLGQLAQGLQGIQQNPYAQQLGNIGRDIDAQRRFIEQAIREKLERENSQ